MVSVKDQSPSISIMKIFCVIHTGGNERKQSVLWGSIILRLMWCNEVMVTFLYKQTSTYCTIAYWWILHIASGIHKVGYLCCVLSNIVLVTSSFNSNSQTKQALYNKCLYLKEIIVLPTVLNLTEGSMQ